MLAEAGKKDRADDYLLKKKPIGNSWASGCTAIHLSSG